MDRPQAAPETVRLYEQVAAALEIPVGTVRSRLNRARTKVREALGGTDPTMTFEENLSHE